MRHSMDATHFDATPEDRGTEGLGLFDTFEQDQEAASLKQEQESHLDAKFAAFHEANPAVYAEIERRALAFVAEGRTRIGVKRIIEDMREEWSARTQGDEWKLNNSYTSRYSRLLLQQQPQLHGVIETRALKREAQS